MSLKQLQKTLKLVPDGLFGPNTFKAASFYLGIPTHFRAVHFWAQVSHETGNFKLFEENLNYSTKGLRAIFGKYFKTYEEAQKYARKPSMIANKVYGNRMGNGDELSGDGWKYRGRGALQLTGKYNYEDFANYMSNDAIIFHPELVSDKYAFESAMFYFDNHNLWDICDKGLDEKEIKQLTKRINGGFNGLAHRIQLTNKYSKWDI